MTPFPARAALAGAVAVLQAGFAVAQEGQFPNPMLAQVPVDWCVTYGVQCGQPAADLFCRTQGYASARAWSAAEVQQTIVLGDLQRCVNASCDALTGVVCTMGGAPAGGAAPAGGLVPLKLYWHGGRGDNFLTGTAEGEASAIAAGYVFVRVEGYAYAAEMPGTVPLWLYWHAGREDNMTATAVGGPVATGHGYAQVRIEGWVYPQQVAGTIPLNNWWNAPREDNFQTATAAGDADARGSGYGFAWTEGYVFPP